jgi:hypothetical protein
MLHSTATRLFHQQNINIIEYDCNYCILNLSYVTVDEMAVNKQLNDKERVAAALENPNLRQLVDECLCFNDPYSR